MKLLFSRHKKENIHGKIVANQQNQETIMHKYFRTFPGCF